MKASANGHLAIVETLLKNGAVVNEKDEVRVLLLISVARSD
jgi:hypothetical protein